MYSLSKYIYTTIFVVFSLISVGQNRFTAGYLITNEGDTLTGELAIRKDIKNYPSAIFQREGQVQTYSSSEIRGFGYTGGKAFVSGIQEGVFVELLILGKLSLYKYDKQYYLKKGDEPQLLKKDELPANKLGYGEQRKVDNKWKGILGYAISDCQRDLNEQLGRAGFLEKDITNIVITYNQCMNTPFIAPMGNQKWTKLEFGATVGITRTAIDNLSFFPDNAASTTVAGGLMLNISSPRISDRISFQSEILLVSAKYDATIVNRLGPDGTRTLDNTFEFQKLSIPIAFKYWFRTKAMNYYALTGFSGEFLLNSKFEVVQTDDRNDGITRPPFFLENIAEMQSVQLGLWAGLGVEKSIKDFKVGGFVRYSFLYNFFDQPGWEGVNGNRTSLSFYFIKEI